MAHVYSFDLSNFESGQLRATRYPAGSAVGGDWVCVALDDAHAQKQAEVAAINEWFAPENRTPHDFEIEFVDA